MKRKRKRSVWVNAEVLRQQAVPYERGEMGGYLASVEHWAVPVSKITEAQIEADDTEPVINAHWIDKTDWWCGKFKVGLYECSNCGYKRGDKPEPKVAGSGGKRCAECGAYMAAMIERA